MYRKMAVGICSRQAWVRSRLLGWGGLQTVAVGVWCGQYDSSRSWGAGSGVVRGRAAAGYGWQGVGLCSCVGLQGNAAVSALAAESKQGPWVDLLH